MAFDSKKFLVRTGSAAVFVVVLLGCIFWSYLSFSLLFFVIAMWGLHEFYKLMKLRGNTPQTWVGYYLSFTGFIIVFSLHIHEFVGLENMRLFYYNNFLDKTLQLILTTVPVVLFVFPVIELFRNKDKPFESLGITLFGCLYVVVPFLLLNHISVMFLPSLSDYSDPTMAALMASHYKPQLILAIFLLIWSNDTFAYLVGSFIGKHKMIERISPGKTWEGTIGGGLLTIAASFLIWKWFGLLEFYDWIIIAAIVTVFGTLGDLVESMLKRSVGVKDSGKIMPGHGGILDRFDSLIMVAPFVFLYLLFK